MAQFLAPVGGWAGAGFWDPEVREARARLAAHIRDRLLDDYNAAQVPRPSQAALKACFEDAFEACFH